MKVCYSNIFCTLDIEELIRGDEEEKVLFIITYRNECIHLRYPNGETPLLLAAKYGKPNFIVMFLQAGANIKVTNMKKSGTGADV